MSMRFRNWKRYLVCVIMSFWTLPLIAAPPQISYVTNSAPNYSPILIFGEGFTQGKVEFYGFSPQEKLTPAEMLFDLSKANPTPPPTPPENLRPLQLLAIQPQVATVVLYGGGHPGGVKEPYVIWAKNKDGFSEPYIINRPQLFFLERTCAAPGEELRVFGRDMISSQHGYWGGVFLRDSNSGKVWEVKWGKYFDRQNHFNYQLDFEIVFAVPQDIPEGDYELWVHSGTGGWFGWCVRPLMLTVKKTAPPAPKHFNVKDFGAVGDGMTDDTRAIQKAIDEAQKVGGIAFVPPGVYAIRSPLFLHPNTHIRGVRWEMSSIRVVDHLLFKGEYLDQDWQGYARDYLPFLRKAKPLPMMWVCSGASVSDLEMIGGQEVAHNLYSFAKEGEFTDFTVARCRLVNPRSPLYTTTPEFQPGRGCFGGGNPWRRVRIVDNVMHGMSGCGTYGEMNECVIANNQFEPAGGPIGTTGFASIGGRHNIIEGNIIRNSNRGFTCGPWAQKDQGENFIARNQVIEGGMNKGAAESFLVEYASGAADGWLGRVARAGTDWFEGSYGAAGRDFKDPPIPPEAFDENPTNPPKARFKPGLHQGLFAIVIKGRGFGQYRRVARNTEDRIYVDQPWRVIPDSTSWIVVRRMYYNSVFLNNVGRDTLGCLELWGGCLECVVRRHTAMRTGPMLAMTHSEPTLMYNRIEMCQFYESSFAFWNLHIYDYNVKAPTLVGNILMGNQFEGGSILFVRNAYGKRGYVRLDDPDVVDDGPSMAYNVIASNNITPKGDCHAIYLIDPSCFGNVFWRNRFPKDRVVDKGTHTIWADNSDSMVLHVKDSSELDLRAYERGKTK